MWLWEPNFYLKINLYLNIITLNTSHPVTRCVCQFPVIPNLESKPPQHSALCSSQGLSISSFLVIVKLLARNNLTPRHCCSLPNLPNLLGVIKKKKISSDLNRPKHTWYLPTFLPLFLTELHINSLSLSLFRGLPEKYKSEVIHKDCNTTKAERISTNTVKHKTCECENTGPLW